MPLSWETIQANAVAFSKRWENAHNEQAQGQAFTLDFFKVFGVADPEAIGNFEYKVPLDDGHTGYIDYLWKKRIALEMKSLGKNLNKAYGQLKEYVFHLPDDEIPDLLMVCDFATIVLHNRTTGKKVSFKTKELRKHIKRFADIAGYETTRVYENQVEVNVKAAEKMARLHDALKTHGYAGHDLEVYLVRLLFCMFAEDTGIFSQDYFLNYVENSKADGSDLSERIGKLFEMLNMPDAIRAKRTLLSADLKQFRYINGGLFKDLLPTAEFDGTMRQTLIECCKFDWSKISPAIFGAMFQGVMDKERRRELGIHYTSEENILKLINPLFMDELWHEFEQVKIDPAQLECFHNKISKLKFLDPALGCGNFLIIAYRELRLLELEILKMKISSSQLHLDIAPMLKVSVEQFYGIELEDFPCQIAQVGMWLIDHQMNLRVSEQFGQYYARLPLTKSATIVHGNALRIDWNSVVHKDKVSCILGNPPFVGQALRTKEQSAEMKNVFSDDGNAMKLDYVAAWFKKATDFMINTNIQTAFVSVNSVCQGESVSTLWKYLFDQGIRINFAYQTFKWSNEAKEKAAVMCVIVGFSIGYEIKEKRLYSNEEHYIITEHINGYLHSAPDVFIKTRSKSINKYIAKVMQGSPPADNGDLQLSKNEMIEFISKYPETKEFIKPFLGSKEFINDVCEPSRYCFWLKGISPNKFNKIPEIRDRLQRIAIYRASSPVDRIQKTATTPYLFTQDRQPDSNFIVIPRHSSEKRKYIPMGFLNKETIVSDAVVVVSNATLYDFGILSSNVHMIWVRTVCGRIKNDYRYAPSVFYNFPLPDAIDAQKYNVELAAQNILSTRVMSPDNSLADLYDPLTMPPELLKAHTALDAAVMKLYGFSKDMTEAKVVAALMERYQALVSAQGE